MPQIPDNNQVFWETVGLPLARGVDLRTPGRAVAQQRLLKFENGKFAEADAGLVRRRGHDEYIVNKVDSLIDAGPGEQWLFGTGMTNDEGEDIDRPDVGRLFGLAKRDTEVLAWDGYKLLSWPPGVGKNAPWQTPGGSAVFPRAKTTPIAKDIVAQRHGDLGVGTRVAVVAWLDNVTGRAKLSVFDSVTWAPLLTNHVLSPVNPNQVRVVPMGDWVHVLVSTPTTLDMFSVNADVPQIVSAGLTALGACVTYFDCRKLSDTRFAVIKRDTTDTARLTYLKADGSTDLTFCAANTALDTLPTADSTVERLGFDVHPQTGEVCLVWRSTATAGSVFGAIYTAEGVRRGGRYTLTSGGNTYSHVTVTALFELHPPDPTYGTFRWYGSDDRLVAGTTPRVLSGEFTGASGAGAITTRYWVSLSHQAFRVGNKPFVFLRHAYKTGDSAVRLQRMYFIADADLKSVGMLERGTAADGMVGLSSVHFYDGQETMNRSRFHAYIAYRQRLDSENNDQFDEESPKLLDLDFLPKLRSAQLGRTLYIAGAQLCQYDGRQVVEVGQQVFPEMTTTVLGAAGSVNGTVRYRARWAWKNAQGEEEVSASILTNELVVTNDQVVVTVRTHGMTRKENVYLLLYRNEGDGGNGTPGTQWYLVTSRDPSHANFVKNNPEAETVAFTDNTSDATLIAGEKDRADAGLLEPFPAPACEVIAVGRDRLWLAGGEIPTGSMQPSLLHAAGEIATFNTYVQTVVDQGADPITAFAFMGNSTMVFKAQRVYSFEADGPSNTALGSFDTPRVIAADTGAIGQESVLLTTQGVVFQSPGGFQLLATNYQIVDIGAPVRPATLTADVAAAILVPDDRELRFYLTNGDCLVYFYSNGEWGTWTGLEAMGAVMHNGRAVVGRSNGRLLVERDGAWSDGGRGYEMVVRLAWLHKNNTMQGLCRVRRVGVLGDLFGDCTLTFRAYYDDKVSPDDKWTWTPASSNDADGDLNPTELGDRNEGGSGLGTTGLLGDYFATVNSLTQPRVRTLGELRRLARQKCSRFSLEIRDGSPNNKGIGLTEVALELGLRGGLNKLPTRTHTA